VAFPLFSFFQFSLLGTGIFPAAQSFLSPGPISLYRSPPPFRTTFSVAISAGFTRRNNPPYSFFRHHPLNSPGSPLPPLLLEVFPHPSPPFFVLTEVCAPPALNFPRSGQFQSNLMKICAVDAMLFRPHAPPSFPPIPHRECVCSAVAFGPDSQQGPSSPP